MAPYDGTPPSRIDPELQHVHRRGRVPKIRLTATFPTDWSDDRLESTYRVYILENNQPIARDLRPKDYPPAPFLTSCGGGNYETRYRTMGVLKSTYILNQGAGSRPVLFMEENWWPADGRKNHKWALLSSVVLAANREGTASVSWWCFAEDSERSDDQRWYDYRRHHDESLWICLRRGGGGGYWGGGEYRRAEAKANLEAQRANGGRDV